MNRPGFQTSPRCRRTRRGAFSLVEAMLAVTLVSLSGSALLLGMNSSIQATQQSLDSAIATGMAEQLIDEVLGRRYMAVGGNPYQYPLVANSWETGGNGRERFDDADDYNGFVAEPAENVWGNEPGTGDGDGGLRHPNFRIQAGYFSDWRQEISVYYVDENDPSVALSGSASSNLRAVEVRILRRTQSGDLEEITTLRRVFAYVPPIQ